MPFRSLRVVALAGLCLASSTLALAAEPLFAGRFADYRAGDKVVGVYVPNWQPATTLERIKTGNATHLLYAFVRICGPGQLPKDAQVCRGKADFELAVSPTERRFDQAFARVKQRAPHLKVLASVGGWGGSDPFFHLANEAARRAVFVASVVDFLEKHAHFDGIDIDWEHPTSNGSANGVALGSPADGQGYADLMHELRRAVDALGERTGRKYLVIAAINTTEPLVRKVKHGEAAKALDLVFMMTYDFHGSWTPLAGHHAPLRSPTPGSTESLEGAVRVMTGAGVPAAKLVAGVAMYGRGFDGIAGPDPAKGFNGVARKNVFPPGEGAAAYRDIAREQLGRDGRGIRGWRSVFDETTQSWSLWHEKQGRYLGYDDPRAVEAKGRFAVESGLAGVFAWELSQDNGDILNAMNRGVGNPLNATRRRH